MEEEIKLTLYFKAILKMVNFQDIIIAIIKNTIMSVDKGLEKLAPS